MSPVHMYTCHAHTAANVSSLGGVRCTMHIRSLEFLPPVLQGRDHEGCLMLCVLHELTGRHAALEPRRCCQGGMTAAVGSTEWEKWGVQAR